MTQMICGLVVSLDVDAWIGHREGAFYFSTSSPPEWHGLERSVKRGWFSRRLTYNSAIIVSNISYLLL